MRISDWSSDVCSSDLPPDFSGFNDPAKGKEIALGQYSAGADVIYHAAGGSGGGLFEAALETGDVWAIGVDSDQYLTAEEAVQDVIITSLIKRVDVAVFEAIRSFTEGNLEAGAQEFDLSNDGVRSEEGRGGKECVSTGRSRVWRDHKKKK